MAKAKKKSSAESKSKSISNLAKTGFIGPASPGIYSKYGDISPSEVHEGPATFRGVSRIDHPDTNIRQYSSNVKGGHGKDYFILQGKLYQINNASGTSYSEIKK